MYASNVTSHCLQQQNKNVVELSGTGVPPSLLDEVQERRSGAYRGGGAAYRLVPAEIKHWVKSIPYCSLPLRQTSLNIYVIFAANYSQIIIPKQCHHQMGRRMID